MANGVKADGPIAYGGQAGRRAAPDETAAVSRPLVHVVEDDESVRSAIVRVLRETGFDARPYASAAEFLLAAGEGPSGCIVLDVGLPGMSGIELHAALAKKHECSVVFITGSSTLSMGVRAMRDGAVDFLDKPVTRERLLEAVSRGVERDVSARRRREQMAALFDLYGELTLRERQVFSLVTQGKLNKQIAGEIGTSLRTVKSHRARVMEKMRASSIADLVRAADQLNAALPH